MYMVWNTNPCHYCGYDSCQNPFSAILRLKKKVPMAIKLEGEGVRP